ncbi:leader peptidase (prepilin peptidase)/N-methyltransferase [Sediminihabitans luteus]|uniref:Leader peptidase (Prepilin peptidase)/N-methyltransferase n=1 Tax=Sediminihabitans luteus TaxID=1138585 RepID=A0A2M9CQS5_9CELL|nr:A24 family peptidase [Sediminihabitans luteus]PJJ74185.1 leader peptidase (prepilin peptidase)/N-methyltransferase [Sediminihabitans luteus]GII99038.1 hypothetical protein Slu03_14160 [Sediminihabitans luteus]
MSATAVVRRTRARARAEIAPYRVPALTLGGVLALACGLWCAGQGRWAELPALVTAAGALGVLVVVDARTHRLPDAIVLPALVATVVLLALATVGTALVIGTTVEGTAVGTGTAVGSGSDPWRPFVRALAAGGVLFSAYLLLALAGPRGGLGFGDVKLAALLGVALGWLGWGPVVVATFAAFAVGGVWAVALLVTGRATRSSAIPFGPCMVAGAVLGAACAGVPVAALV